MLRSNSTDYSERQGQAARIAASWKKDKESVCATCTTSRGWETFQDVVRSRVDSMLVQDWITLLLASIVVAFAVFAEIRDCMLCEIALREISKQRDVPRGWRYAIHGLNFVRYILLLPNIIVSVMSLVHEDGGRVKLRVSQHRGSTLFVRGG